MDIKHNTMKRILFPLLALTWAVTASAQYAPGSLQRKGTHLEAQGVRLSEAEMNAVLSDIGGVNYNEDWNDWTTRRNTGMGLTLGGAAVGIAGGVVVMLGAAVSIAGMGAGAIVGSIGGQEGAQQAAEAGAQAGKPYLTAGTIAGLAGLTSFCVGLPMWISNTKKMNGVVNQYNADKPQASLTFGSTDSGIGFRFNF